MHRKVFLRSPALTLEPVDFDQIRNESGSHVTAVKTCLEGVAQKRTIFPVAAGEETAPFKRLFPMLFAGNPIANH